MFGIIIKTFVLLSSTVYASNHTKCVLLSKLCIPNKTEDLNQRFQHDYCINEWKTLKRISCECIYDGKKCNSNQWWNNNKCHCEFKKHICEKDYVWNPATCNSENRKYLASIMDDWMIMCDEVLKSYDEEIKTISTNFNEKKI